MDQDPYQVDHSGTTDNYTAHHQWWKPIAWVVGGRIAGEYDSRYHPVRFRILSIIFAIAIVTIVILLIHGAATDPRNTPLPPPLNPTP